MSYTNPTNLIGQTLANGRYRIMDLIALGDRSDVFRGSDERLQINVVIKLIKPIPNEQGDHLERLFRKIAEVHHPHVCSLMDFGKTDGHWYSVSQYLGGGSLFERIQKKHPSCTPPITPTKIAWLADIANALDFLHAKGLLHLQINPKNILFDEADVAYIADLEIANVFRPVIPTSELIPKDLFGVDMTMATYMAPEKIMGKDCDGQADQYSLAIMVYELLAGRAPFQGNNPAAVMVKHTTEQVPPVTEFNPNLPMHVWDALKKALSKQKEQRFPTCSAFVQAVISALATPTGPGPVRAVCPQCYLEVMIPADAVGKNVMCPSCKGRFRWSPGKVDHKPAMPSARMEQAPAPVPISHPSVPYTAPGKSRRSRTRTPAKPETRRATVRYYSRMNPMRLFPFLVIFSKEMIQQISKRGTDQRDSGPFQVDTEAPVDVEPVLPGCTCHPLKITTKLKSDTDSLVFYVVPNVVGKIQGGKVVVTQNHATLAEVPLKMKVVQRTWFYLSAALTVILPFLSALSKHFGWDFETQMDTGFDLYLKVARFVFDLVSPYTLAGILALVTLVAYWMTRPKRKDEFWDIKLVK